MAVKAITTDLSRELNTRFKAGRPLRAKTAVAFGKTNCVGNGKPVVRRAIPHQCKRAVHVIPPIVAVAATVDARTILVSDNARESTAESEEIGMKSREGYNACIHFAILASSFCTRGVKPTQGVE